VLAVLAPQRLNLMISEAEEYLKQTSTQKVNTRRAIVWLTGPSPVTRAPQKQESGPLAAKGCLRAEVASIS